MASRLESHPEINEGPSGNKSPELKFFREIKVIAGGPTVGGESNSA